MSVSVSCTLPISARSGWAVPVVPEDARRPADPSLASLPEPDLIAACIAGRDGAFDLIVERHRRTVYQVCYRFVGNHEDASDLTQDVFLRAFRGRSKFRG